MKEPGAPTRPRWQLQPKISRATGQQDDSEYMVVDMTNCPPQQAPRRSRSMWPA